MEKNVKLNFELNMKGSGYVSAENKKIGASLGTIFMDSVFTFPLKM